MRSDLEILDWIQSITSQDAIPIEPQHEERKTVVTSTNQYVDPALLQPEAYTSGFGPLSDVNKHPGFPDTTASHQSLNQVPAAPLPLILPEGLAQPAQAIEVPEFPFMTFDSTSKTDVKAEKFAFDFGPTLPPYDPFTEFYPGEYDFLNFDNTANLLPAPTLYNNLNQEWNLPPPVGNYQPVYEYPDPPEPNAPFPIDKLYPPCPRLEPKLTNEPQDIDWLSSLMPFDAPAEIPNYFQAPMPPNPPNSPNAIHRRQSSRKQKATQRDEPNASMTFNIGEQVSYDRKSKKLLDPSCDPSHFYAEPCQALEPWGPKTEDGSPLFSYLPQGQLTLSKQYTAEEIRQYLRDCPRKAVAWVQQAPAQCNHRLSHVERKCRYTDCPDRNNSILPGWLRVAFDEFSTATTNGTKDPFKVAMVMHLYCFEQCFDPMELYMEGRLLPEDRALLRETKNPMAITKNSDARIVGETFEPWFKWNEKRWRQGGAVKVPRPYKETLSHALVGHHLDNQIQSRQRTRSKRNSAKSKDDWNTIDVHRGDLSVYARRYDRRRYDMHPTPYMPTRDLKVGQKRQGITRSRQLSKSKEEDELWKPVSAIPKSKLRQMLPPIYTGGLAFPARDHGLRSATKRRRESEAQQCDEPGRNKRRRLNSYYRKDE